jgi:succinoglycan biosynthesis protein ExoU
LTEGLSDGTYGVDMRGFVAEGALDIDEIHQRIRGDRHLIEVSDSMRVTIGIDAASPTISGAPGGKAVAAVDVLIAARNRSDTIERAVSSALVQDEVRTVIVVDDGSSDDTAARSRECDPEGGRVVVERLRSSLGPAAARNIALGLSRAPWVAILDGDDFFLPGRIGTLLAKAGEWDFVADDLLEVQEGRLDEQTPAPVLFGGRPEPFALDFEQFVLGNVGRHGALRREFGFLKPLIRRSFLDRHQLRYDEALRLGEDYALYARALAAGARFLILPTGGGYVSVVRAGSLSATHSRQDLERLRDSDAELLNAKMSASEHRALRKHYSSVDCRVQWLAVIEAVKSRQYRAFIAAFCRSPKVSTYLAARLIEELHARIRKPSVEASQEQRRSPT